MVDCTLCITRIAAPASVHKLYDSELCVIKEHTVQFVNLNTELNVLPIMWYSVQFSIVCQRRWAEFTIQPHFMTQCRILASDLTQGNMSICLWHKTFILLSEYVTLPTKRYFKVLDFLKFALLPDTDSSWSISSLTEIQ